MADLWSWFTQASSSGLAPWQYVLGLAALALPVLILIFWKGR